MSSSREPNFFCHLCENRISISPNSVLKCPRCGSECIEERAQNRRRESGINALVQGMSRIALEASRGQRRRSPTGLSGLEQLFHVREVSPDVGRGLFGEVMNQLARVGREQNSDQARMFYGFWGQDRDEEGEDVSTTRGNQTDVDSLLEVVITQHHIKEKTDCAICHEDFELGSKVLTLPCSHLYHKECIGEWLEQHDTCPVCRASVSNPRGQDSNIWDFDEEEADAGSRRYADANSREPSNNASVRNADAQAAAAATVGMAPSPDCWDTGLVDGAFFPEPAVFQANQQDQADERRQFSHETQSDSPFEWPFNTLFEKP